CRPPQGDDRGAAQLHPPRAGLLASRGLQTGSGSDVSRLGPDFRVWQQGVRPDRRGRQRGGSGSWQLGGWPWTRGPVLARRHCIQGGTLRPLVVYLRRHHLALIALFVVLGGTSYAAAG